MESFHLGALGRVPLPCPCYPPSQHLLVLLHSHRTKECRIQIGCNPLFQGLETVSAASFHPRLCLGVGAGSTRCGPAVGGRPQGQRQGQAQEEVEALVFIRLPAAPPTHKPQAQRGGGPSQIPNSPPPRHIGSGGGRVGRRHRSLPCSIHMLCACHAWLDRGKGTSKGGAIPKLQSTPLPGALVQGGACRAPPPEATRAMRSSLPRSIHMLCACHAWLDRGKGRSKEERGRVCEES